MRGRPWIMRIGTWLPVLALLWCGCPATEDDDAGDDDTYTGPSEATINLNVLGTVGGEEYTLLSIYSGDEITSCTAQGDEFHLVSDGSLIKTDGQLRVEAAGWESDTSVHPSQSLNAEADGGTYQVTIPEAPNDPFVFDQGSCFIFIQTEPEACSNNPAIPYCGNISCGSDETSMLNEAGDGVRVTGTFNCYE